MKKFLAILFVLMFGYKYVKNMNYVEVEAKLNDAVADAEGKIAAHLEQGDYETALEVLASLRAPIDAFFADVMVMDEDLALRANRMRLLNRFVGVFANIADFGKMAKSGK